MPRSNRLSASNRLISTVKRSWGGRTTGPGSQPPQRLTTYIGEAVSESVVDADSEDDLLVNAVAWADGMEPEPGS